MPNYSDITIHHRFASSTQVEKFLLSYNGQYYEANQPIVELLEELQRYPEERKAIESYILKKERKYTSDQVYQVIEKYISPIFLAVPKKRTFLYERKLFSATSNRQVLGQIQFLI